MVPKQEQENIVANVHFLQAQIAARSVAAGRSAAAVRLVAVTKTQDWDRIAQAIGAGAVIIGENRWQEARDKLPQAWVDLAPGAGEAAGCSRVGLHFIGHLQKNKVKKAVGFFDCIQSVDDAETLELIEREAAQLGKTLEVLFEYNTSGEDSKQGIRSAEELFRLAELAMDQPHIRLKGLMTIGPLGADAHRTQAAFAELANLFRQVGERLAPANWTELSMGMSGDYPLAIAEGATLVRIGTAIFGPRLGATI